jgi:hypothetical protein
MTPTIELGTIIPDTVLAKAVDTVFVRVTVFPHTFLSWRLSSPEIGIRPDLGLDFLGKAATSISSLVGNPILIWNLEISSPLKMIFVSPLKPFHIYGLNPTVLDTIIPKSNNNARSSLSIL